MEFLTAHYADSAVVASAQLSLLTCEPFDEVYSLYGHTAIRVKDSELDIGANWGVFDMRQRFFALRFLFGLTDYRMEIESWERFSYRYHHYGSGIYEQVLVLNDGEKRALLDALIENYKPENRYYRYNWLLDNCTTRVRDLIANQLPLTAESAASDDYLSPTGYSPLSARELIHAWNAQERWYRWMNDFVLGVRAEKTLSEWDAMFLPWNLSAALPEGQWALPSHGAIVDRQLVEQPSSARGFLMLTPQLVALLFAALFVVVFIIERRTKRRLWVFDLFALLATGVLGLILFCMIFSQHPTVSLNCQILVCNPLSLVALPPVIKSLRHGKRSKWLSFFALCTAVGLILSLFVQQFAEGMQCLALFLLITYIRR